MAHKDNIREGLQVIGSDGGMIGTVKGLHGDHIHVEPSVPSHSGDHTVPLAWVARADDHVHLNREAALVRDTWGSGEGHVIPPPHGATTTTASTTQTSETPHRPDAHKSMGKSWIVWLIGALLLLLIIVLGVRGFSYAADDSDMEQPAVNAPDA